MHACTGSAFTSRSGLLTLVSCRMHLDSLYSSRQWNLTIFLLCIMSCCSCLAWSCCKAYGANVFCTYAGNIAIFIHLLGAFQVWMQPLYGEQATMICFRFSSKTMSGLQAHRDPSRPWLRQGSACNLKLCRCLAQASWRCLCTRDFRGRHGCSMTSLPPRSDQGQTLHMSLHTASALCFPIT